MNITEDRLIKGNKYLIAYNGIFEYDGYIGPGTQTGKTDDINGKVYGFVIDIKESTEEDPHWFPIESIFEVK